MQCLWCHEKYSLRAVGLCPFVSRDVALQFLDILKRHLSDSVDERLHLLGNQWLGRGNEEDQPVTEPSVEVEHGCGGNECLAQPSR